MSNSHDDNAAVTQIFKVSIILWIFLMYRKHFITKSLKISHPQKFMPQYAVNIVLSLL